METTFVLENKHGDLERNRTGWDGETLSTIFDLVGRGEDVTSQAHTDLPLVLASVPLILINMIYHLTTLHHDLAQVR